MASPTSSIHASRRFSRGGATIWLTSSIPRLPTSGRAPSAPRAIASAASLAPALGTASLSSSATAADGSSPQQALLREEWKKGGDYGWNRLNDSHCHIRTSLLCFGMNQLVNLRGHSQERYRDSHCCGELPA